MRQRLQRLFDRIKHTLRRVLIGLMFIVAVILATVVLLTPGEISDAIEGVSIFVRIMILLVVYAIVAFVVYQEVTDDDESDLEGLIVKNPGGTITTLDPESARDRISHALGAISGIDQTSVDVQAVRGKAQIKVNVVVQNESVNIPEKQREIDKTLEKVVEKQLGLQMAERPQIQLSFKHDSTSVSDPIVKPASQKNDPPSGVGVSPKVEINSTKSTDVEKPPKPLEETKDSPTSAGGEDDDPAFWSFLEKTSQENSTEDEKGEKSD